MALRISSQIASRLAAVGWCVAWSVVCTSGCGGQVVPQNGAAEAQSRSATAGAQGEKILTGSIHGTIADQSGALMAGARVQLVRQGRPGEDAHGKNSSAPRETLSGGDGQFAFLDVEPGRFRLVITASGFAAQPVSGELEAGEISTLPVIVLAVAANVTQVEVGLPQIEIAAEQVKIEEKQRVLGAIPNFFVSYIPTAVPLAPQQKFQLAFKTVTDPVTILLVGVGAGLQQANDQFNGYGQGAQGYGKRFGAGYADTVSGTFIGSAILPSVLKQDPRYFYKGRGSNMARFFYAIANAFICKGDNGEWQPNYSSVIGSFAAGGISNIYYPAQNRGVGLTLENAGLGIGGSAIANVFQEFIVKKLTPKAGKTNVAP